MFRSVGFGLWLVLMVADAIHAEDAVVENVVFAIHGGIGLDKAEMTPEIDKRVRAELEQALRTDSPRSTNQTRLDWMRSKRRFA